jgi:hypothetical protein
MDSTIVVTGGAVDTTSIAMNNEVIATTGMGVIFIEDESSATSTAMDSSIDETPSPYRDISTDTSDSLARANRTGLNHWNAFLTKLHSINPTKYPYREYDPTIIPASYFSKKLFGQFPDFLMQQDFINKLNTVLGYVSKIKGFLENDYGGNGTGTAIAHKRWYNKLRTNVANIYFKKGKKVVDSAPQMTESDLDVCCFMLFSRETSAANEDRALFSWQWTCVGRISEPGNMQFPDLTLLRNAWRSVITLVLTRSKTGLQQEIAVVLHAFKFTVCPYHSLATLIVLNKSPDPLFFPLMKAAKSTASLSRDRYGIGAH